MNGPPCTPKVCVSLTSIQSAACAGAFMKQPGCQALIRALSPSTKILYSGQFAVDLESTDLYEGIQWDFVATAMRSTGWINWIERFDDIRKAAETGDFVAEIIMARYTILKIKEKILPKTNLNFTGNQFQIYAHAAKQFIRKK